MKKQILFLSLTVVLALTAMSSLLLQNQPVESGKRLLFADLNGNQLVEITLENAQGVLLNISNNNDAWMAEVEGLETPYPVDKEQLSEFVSNLNSVTLFEAKTSKPKNYPRLGLQNISTDDSQATLITLKASNQEWQVLLGNLAVSGTGHYARKPSENRSWLLSNTINLPTEKFQWLKQPILDLDVSSVQRVAMIGENSWEIVRATDGEGQFKLMDLPDDRTLKYAAILDGLVDNLVGIRFDRLQPYVPELWQSFDVQSVLSVETLQGQQLTITTALLENTYYLMLSDPSGSSGQYWQDIIYTISSFTAGQLNKGIEDFLSEVEEPSISGVAPAIDEGESPN
jgi:hypothetical protein